MNDCRRQLRERKSVRAYEDRPVEPEVKRAILEAAIQAPTAGNMALYTILDITDPAKMEQRIQPGNEPFLCRNGEGLAGIIP